MEFIEAEGPLAHLLSDFGPSATSDPDYHFHNLTNDRRWVVGQAR